MHEFECQSKPNHSPSTEEMSVPPCKNTTNTQESKLLDTTLDTSCFSNLPDKGQHRTKHSAQLLEFECLRPSTPQSLRRVLCQRICAWGEPLQKCAALLSFTSATQVSQLISVGNVLTFSKFCQVITFPGSSKLLTTVARL